MRLTKHHGLGNDFLVLLDPDGAHPAGPELARALCDRRRGIGADGLIHAAPAPDAGADLTMVLHNADGSRAEMSGNGIRCLAQAEARRRGLAHLSLTVATDAGLREAAVRPGPDPHTAQVTVDMGAVGDLLETHPRALEASGGWIVTAGTGAKEVALLDVGNPHLVLLVDDLAGRDPTLEGPRYEGWVAGGTNVEWVTPAAGAADTLDVVVWERGAGATQACGTGACASVAAARRWGLVGDRVQVRMPGGEVHVTLEGDHATLAGPATFVAAVEVPDRWR